MRFFVYILILLSITACGKDKEEAFQCNESVMDTLRQLDSSKAITEQNQAVQSLFSSTPKSRYSSSGYCVDSYSFEQFNKDTFDWCYYVKIDVDCSTKKITSIYED